MHIQALGDAALLVTVGKTVGDATLERVIQVAQAIRVSAIEGVDEVVPAFTTVAVHLRRNAGFDAVRREIERLLKSLPAEGATVTGENREIPVFYGGEGGPDLAVVAEYTGFTMDEVVQRHAGGRYRVHAVGFAPGFPYLAGLERALHCPRRAEPRTRVAAGSVGIGGDQTGVYPLATPGGWQLIGRSPLRFFDPSADPPTLFNVGDWVRFRPVAEGKADTGSTSAARSLAVEEPLTPATHADAPTLEILRPGLQAMVQDLGRPGWQDQGIPPGGAMDAHALRLANVLVGNAEGSAGLEWTLRGPVVRFDRSTCVAVTGAGSRNAPKGRPFAVAAGDVLDLAELSGGCRGVLAVAGGIDVPAVLGGKGTYLRADMGGHEGRVLRGGDRLRLGTSDVRDAKTGWTVIPRFQAVITNPLIVRVVRGPQADWFSAAAWRTFLGEVFEVSPHSDRMGVRLTGRRVEPIEPAELTSEPVACGTVQIPPNGHPIVLMADRQSLGGYPKIANVVSVDLTLMAQARPRTRVRFVEVGLPEAVALREAEERDWVFLREGVRQKLIRRIDGVD